MLVHPSPFRSLAALETSPASKAVGVGPGAASDTDHMALPLDGRLGCQHVRRPSGANTLLVPAEPFAPCDQSLIGTQARRPQYVPLSSNGQLQLPVRRVKTSARLAWPVAAGDNRTVIDPLERWREYGEKPDYAGLLTYGGAQYTQDPAKLAGVRRRDRRRADRRPRLRPAGRPLRAARDPRRLLPARAAPRVEGRRLRGAEDRRLRRRARAARRRRALARGDRAARRPGSSTQA